MGDKTGIEWTDATWNPVRGCSRVSTGCENCYAERVAMRFSKPGQAYEGLADRRGWTRSVRLVPEHLEDPLRWRRPRRVFVNSMSDLFHEGLKDEEIAAVFGVMAAAPQHTFQVLTKRAERMRRWFEWVQQEPELGCDAIGMCEQAALDLGVDARELEIPAATPWPLPNVWIGVSAEDQSRLDERWPHLRDTPAAVRFVSYEPALGPVDWCQALPAKPGDFCDRHGLMVVQETARPGVDWIIVGGESGTGARPFDVEWARSTVAQSRAAGVGVFVKQLGADPRGICSWPDHDKQPPRMVDDNGTFVEVSGQPGTLCHSVGDSWFPCRLKLKDRKGGDMDEWPEELRVREFPQASNEVEKGAT